MLWLKNALQAGGLEEGVQARPSPPHRIAVANAVYDTVRSSMKGQPDPLVESAIHQAQREADLLYLLIVYTNMTVLEDREQRRREYVFLLGYLAGGVNVKTTKKQVQFWRLVVLLFLKSVIILDATIAQVVSEHFDGQPILFRDCEAKLREQLQLAEEVSAIFNSLAGSVGSARINLEELRKSLQSETDRQVSLWISNTHMNTLSALGNSQEMRAAMDRHLVLCEPKSAEPKSLEFCINPTGEITGSYLDANNAYHRFVYDANGTRTEGCVSRNSGAQSAER
jgi:hypothetical protein